jgi:DNA-directed RNA polymerase subunit RPC12/RpoP
MSHKCGICGSEFDYLDEAISCENKCRTKDKHRLYKCACCKKEYTDLESAKTCFLRCQKPIECKSLLEY